MSEVDGIRSDHNGVELALTKPYKTSNHHVMLLVVGMRELFLQGYPQSRFTSRSFGYIYYYIQRYPIIQQLPVMIKLSGSPFSVFP